VSPQAATPDFTGKTSSGRRPGGISSRAATWLAWWVSALSLALTAPGLLLLVVSHSPVAAPVYAGAPVFDYWLVNTVTVVAISFSVVGAVIAPPFPP